MEFILLGLILFICGWFYMAYTEVIKTKNIVREASSCIDVQLRKRYDLIPNVLTIAQKFMEHEKNLIEEITKLRTLAMHAKSGTSSYMAANAQLDSLLTQFKISVENYPNLKSDTTMLQAMQTYNEVEEHISAARRFYNSALTQLKNSTQIFPGTIFANLATEELTYVYYETAESIKQPINASDYLK